MSNREKNRSNGTSQKMSFFKKIYTSPNWRIFSISISVLLFIFVFMACITYELMKNREDVINAYREEQNQYLKLLSYTISHLYDETGSMDAVYEFLEQETDSSGERFVVLNDETTVLWAQNAQTTETLGEYTDVTAFWHMINEQNVVVDRVSCSCGETTYTVNVVTDEDSILDAATVTEHDYYIVLATGIVSVVLISLLITLLGFWNRTEKNLKGAKHELHIRNRKLEEVTWSAEGLTMKDMEHAAQNMPEKTEKPTSGIERNHSGRTSYRFKFYMDARHSIYINGHMGEVHPHTWEIILETVKDEHNFVRFDQVEHAMERTIEPFQNQYINEIAPFDVMNPTIENLADYFRERMQETLSLMGWEFVSLEISETPGRSYVVMK